MKWFQIKEQSAGEKRLLLSYFLYKIFGKRMVYFIAFLVSFCTFLFAPRVREFSKKYFTVIKDYTKLKPSLINQFKHIYSYAKSLADKMMVCCGDFNPDDIVFENENDKEQLKNDICDKKGVFFICNHIGNIELFQSFFIKSALKDKISVNIFVSNRQSQIFNSFLKKIKLDFPLKLFYIEDLGINTGVELKENLDNGDIVFIAGDRLSENNDTKNVEQTMFNKKIFLPKGTYKLAKLMNVPTYLVSVISKNNKYRVFMEKQNNLDESALAASCAKFMERVTLVSPFQFFNFYDFFMVE